MIRLNLNSLVRSALKTPAVRTALKEAGKQLEAELVRDVKRWTDGFQAARVTAPKTEATSTGNASDTAFVTGLYRELLGRAPDIGGFNAHVTALRNGVSREALRQVFLDSDEFKAKSAPAVEAPVASAPKTEVERLKQLIDADLKTAYGRPATESDYAYWLPKLQEPCDSGFVTSGQMTGVEYYHRRMLGWQAGGSDLATSGPYAGSPEARRPVPSAIDVMGGAEINPSEPVATPSMSSTEQLRKLIAADIRMAGNRDATERDYAYWLPLLQSPCDSGFVTSGQMTGVEYYHRRMLGWQAGGEDQAIAGPYAFSPDARGPVPSAVSIVGDLIG
jgi:hypothetical protein